MPLFLKTPCARLALVAYLGVQFAASAFAQQKPNEPAAKDDQLITLSPFVVDSSKDQGYRATSTLAGSRINTDLKDVAASVTVVTREFFQDVSAVDINDILTYTANAEGTHDFTSTQSGSRNGPPGVYADNVASDPNGSNRIRGLFAADITRDYFYTIGGFLGFDTYNLDSVTINRGPNSVLAGLGSPAGIINYSPMIAGLAKNDNELTYRFGSYSDQRATLNSNVVALKNVLGFRVAAEYGDKGFRQKPAYDHDKRFYITGTYRPWRTTTIRAGFEAIYVDNHLPNTVTPFDDITQWIALGKPVSDITSSAPVSSYLSPMLNGALTPILSNGTVGTSYDARGTYRFNQQNVNNVGIWTRVGMSDDRYFNLSKVNTSPTYGDHQGKTETLSIDQEIIPNLFANLSYLHERVDLKHIYPFSNPLYAVYDVDVNAYTPDKKPNPHFGETFMFLGGENGLQTDHDLNRVMRGTLTYDLDLNKFNKWLGRYRATGFAEKRHTETDHEQFDAEDSDLGPNYLRTGGGTISTRYYLGGTAANGYKAQTLRGPAQLFTQVPYTYVDAKTGAVASQTFTDNFYTSQRHKNLTELTSSAAVLQGYLWQDRIVGMFGIRHDTDKAAFTSISVPGDVNPATGQLNPLKPYPPMTSTGAQTKTYSVVVHPLKWLSLHYNHAENFIPNAGAIDLLGHPTPTPTGSGKDYGFSINTPDEKLNLKVNWFELTAANGDAGTNANHLAIWNITYHDLQIGPELAAQAGIPYKQAIAPGIIIGDPRLQYTANTVSKGIEVELTYNPTRAWRIMASVSKQEAQQSGIAPGLTAFVQERLAYWQSIPALWTAQVTAPGGNAWGLTNTGQQHWNQYELSQYLGYKSAEGQPSTQIAKWHASVISNYTMNAGSLKGFSFGGAARYVEKAVIGNPAIYQNVNGSPTVVGLDLAHPYTSPGYVGFDAWIGYSYKFDRNKYVLSFQLNGRDLQTGGKYRPVVANSDGTQAVFRIVQPRTFYLTTKLDF